VQIFPASAIQFAVFHCLKDTLLSARSTRSVHGRGSTASTAGPAPQPQPARQRRGQQQQQAPQHAQQHEAELSNAERLLAGAAAGAASVSFTYPLESARTLMSVAGGMEGSLLSVCRRVVASGGVRALYKGFQATLLGDVMGNALGFTLYEVFNRCTLLLTFRLSAPSSALGGSLSAPSSTTAPATAWPAVCITCFSKLCCTWFCRRPPAYSTFCIKLSSAATGAGHTRTPTVACLRRPPCAV
jgi:hypothetical protein